MLSFAVSSIACADSWEPWEDQLVVAPNGKYYVVMFRSGGPKVAGEWGPVEFTICERAKDSPPLMSAKSNVVVLDDEYDSKGGRLYKIEPNINVEARIGDHILGGGNLKRPPKSIVVSNEGLGFAGIDVWGYNYGHYDEGLKADDAIVIISANGKVIHRKSLVELFADKGLKDFETTAGGMFWSSSRNPGWIDDTLKQLVVVSAENAKQPSQRFVKYLDWQTGEITNGPTLNSDLEVNALHAKHIDRAIVKSRNNALQPRHLRHRVNR